MDTIHPLFYWSALVRQQTYSFRTSCEGNGSGARDQPGQDQL